MFRSTQQKRELGFVQSAGRLLNLWDVDRVTRDYSFRRCRPRVFGLAPMRIEPVEDVFESRHGNSHVCSAGDFDIFDFHSYLFAGLNHIARPLDRDGIVVVAVDDQFRYPGDPVHFFRVAAARYRGDGGEQLRMVNCNGPCPKATHSIPAHLDAIQVDLVGWLDFNHHVEDVLLCRARVHGCGLTSLWAGDDVASFFRFCLKGAVSVLIEDAVLVSSHSVKRNYEWIGPGAIVSRRDIDPVRLQSAVDFRTIGLPEVAVPGGIRIPTRRYIF